MLLIFVSLVIRNLKFSKLLYKQQRVFFFYSWESVAVSKFSTQTSLQEFPLSFFIDGKTLKLVTTFLHSQIMVSLNEKDI